MGLVHRNTLCAIARLLLFYVITAQGKWIETHSRGREGLRNLYKVGVPVRGNAHVEFDFDQKNLSTR